MKIGFIKFNLIFASILALTACEQKNSINPHPVTSINSSSNQQIYNEVQKLNGFASGNMMSNVHAYVLFDPQCPHCGHFWQESKKIKGVAFTWIPVAFLNPKSGPQGATILSSSQPVDIMNIHEELLAKQAGGIVTKDISLENQKKIDNNTQYFKDHFNSVPTIIVQNLKTKEYLVLQGGMPASDFLKVVGLGDGI